MNPSPSLQDSCFFTTYGGGHAAALVPVASLLRSKQLPVQVLALTTAAAAVRRSGIEPWGVGRLIDKVPAYRHARRVGRLLAGSQNQHALVPVEETEAYLGAGFHSAVRASGLPAARRSYEQRGRQGFLPIDFFVSLFERERPRVVVATSAPRSERAALEAARQLGIPSVCVVDLYAPYEIEWCASPGYATKICVLNQAVADRFMERGVEPERLAITGNPAFDRLATLDRAAIRQRVRQALGIAHDHVHVAWISQPEPAKHPFNDSLSGVPEYPANVERHLATHFAGRPNVHLTMRLHPSEDRLPAVSGDRIRYSNASSEPLDDLLCSADCVVTASSTVGLEAALLGVPVIQCMDSIFSEDLPLARLGLAEAVRHCWEAGGGVDTILTQRPRPNATSGSVVPTQIQSAAMSIAGLVAELYFR